jgi:hypothetical protein
LLQTRSEKLEESVRRWLEAVLQELLALHLYSEIKNRSNFPNLGHSIQILHGTQNVSLCVGNTRLARAFVRSAQERRLWIPHVLLTFIIPNTLSFFETETRHRALVQAK